MKRFIIGLLIVGGVIAAVALIVRKRSGSDVDEWDSFADDTLSRASTGATKISDTVGEAASQVSDAAKKAASDMSDAASDASGAVKEAAGKVSDAAKNA
jgi:gas vesicle protein